MSDWNKQLGIILVLGGALIWTALVGGGVIGWFMHGKKVVSTQASPQVQPVRIGWAKPRYQPEKIKPKLKTKVEPVEARPGFFQRLKSWFPSIQQQDKLKAPSKVQPVKLASKPKLKPKEKVRPASQAASSKENPGYTHLIKKWMLAKIKVAEQAPPPPAITPVRVDSGPSKKNPGTIDLLNKWIAVKIEQAQRRPPPMVIPVKIASMPPKDRRSFYQRFVDWENTKSSTAEIIFSFKLWPSKPASNPKSKSKSKTEARRRGGSWADPLGENQWAPEGGSGGWEVDAGDQMRVSIENPGDGLGGASIIVKLPAAGNVSVTVYDAFNVQVKNLYQGYSQRGRSVFQWNGYNEQGDRVKAGYYKVRIIGPRKTRYLHLVL